MFASASQVVHKTYQDLPPKGIQLKSQTWGADKKKSGFYPIYESIFSQDTHNAYIFTILLTFLLYLLIVLFNF